MGNKSMAQIRRELRAIPEPPKNPNRVAAGLKNGAVNKAKHEQTTAEQAYKAIKQKRAGADIATMPKGGKKALNAVIADEKRKDITKQSIQELKRANVLHLFVENSENVAHRLIDLSLGRNGFDDAPASVQRLAMINVLTFAGISQEQAEKTAKPVHEMNSHELQLLIVATEQHLSDVREKQKIVTIDQEP